MVAIEGDLATDGYAPFVEAFEKSVGRKTAIDAETFAELVSPEHFVAVRTRFGGPAPEPLNAALESYEAQSRNFAERMTRNAERKAKAARELNERFAALMEQA